MRRNILITGGCGFIGSNLIDRLARQGNFHVRVYDNESLGKRQHIEGLDAEFVSGDIRDGAAVLRALRGMDAVVHLAAHTRVLESIEDPLHNFDVNARGTLSVLEAMRRSGVRRLINASTGGAILGNVDPPVHERMTPLPIAPYGASKLCAEGYCSAYSGSYGLSALSLRFSNVYGPRSYHKGSVVAAFLKKVLAGQPVTIYGDGSQVRDYIDVADLCNGIVAALQCDVTGAIQLGSGLPVTVNELLDTIDRVVAPGKVARIYEAFRDGEIRQTYCDITKARTELGFNPRTSLLDGVSRTWRWFTEHRPVV